jgi:hypothetical protein
VASLIVDSVPLHPKGEEGKSKASNQKLAACISALFICELAFNQINTFGTILLLRKFNVLKLAKDDETFSLWEPPMETSHKSFNTQQRMTSFSGCII